MLKNIILYIKYLLNKSFFGQVNNIYYNLYIFFFYKATFLFLTGTKKNCK